MTRSLSPTAADSEAKGRLATVVFYDGACPLCAREIALYRRAAGAAEISWCDVNAAQNLPLAREAALARFHVRTADGQLKSGARAFIALWLALPGWRWLGQIANLPPLPYLLEGLYRLFLPVRPRLQALVRRLATAPR